MSTPLPLQAPLPCLSASLFAPGICASRTFYSPNGHRDEGKVVIERQVDVLAREGGRVHDGRHVASYQRVRTPYPIAVLASYQRVHTPYPIAVLASRERGHLQGGAVEQCRRQRT